MSQPNYQPGQPYQQPQPYQPPQQYGVDQVVPQPPRHPQPVATGLAIKRRHPVATWLLWPFLTLGIYHLVWYYKIHKEMAEFDRRRAVPVSGPMLVLLFLSWTLIAPLVSYYNCGTRIRNAQRAAGIQTTCSPGAGVLLMFVFGAGTLYYQMELNNIVDAYGVSEGEQIALRV